MRPETVQRTIPERRKAVNQWRNIIKTQAAEFCRATGFHGYRYIVQSNRTKIERYLWAVVVVFSLCLSLICMQIAWEYNSSHATLTVIESTHHGIWNFPFPAVTVCNNNQVSLRKARRFVNSLRTTRGMSRKDVLKEMRLLVEMLDPGVFDHDIERNLTQLQELLEANNYSIVEVMKSVKQDCSSLLKNCRWKGNSTPCHELFEEAYSRDGSCCSFNYFHSASGIPKQNGEPKRLTACGYQTGLTFLVDPETDDYFSSLYGSYGIKVILHYPYNYPDRSAEYVLVGPGVQNFLGISPEVTYSTRPVLQLPRRLRDCIYGAERLSSARSSPGAAAAPGNYTWSSFYYSYANCLNECRVNATLAHCGCVPYYVPQTAGLFRVCDLRDVACLKNFRTAYDTSWPGEKLNSAELPDFHIDISRRPCNCLPDCKVYRYPVDSTEGILDIQNFKDNKIFSQIKETQNLSLVNVFFTDLVSIQYRRDIYFNWKNLVASFGGLLGLFIGFSLMNAFELVYFFVIRIVADKFINRKK